MILLIFILILLLYINNTNIIKNDNSNLYIDNSNIHGVGIFTKKKYKANDFILNIINNGEIRNISEFGRKVNHSWNPNCYLKKDFNNYNLYALYDISPYEEITADYRYNPWFFKQPESDFI